MSDQNEPRIPLRKGWRWEQTGDEQFPWGAAVLPGRGFGEGDNRCMVALMKLRGVSRTSDGIKVDHFRSRGVEPLDIVLAVILANAPDEFRRAAVGLAVPRDRTQTPEHYIVDGFVKKNEETGAWDVPTGVFMAKAIGVDDASRDYTEDEANEACHAHVDRVIASAFPDLAQQLASQKVRIAELEHERDELQRDHARATAFTNDRHLRDVAYGDPYIIETHRRYADDLFGHGQGARLFPSPDGPNKPTP